MYIIPIFLLSFVVIGQVIPKKKSVESQGREGLYQSEFGEKWDIPQNIVSYWQFEKTKKELDVRDMCRQMNYETV